MTMAPTAFEEVRPAGAIRYSVFILALAVARDGVSVSN